eukprot:COSAG06_NODE_2946_length_6041_cov_16.046914_4_plen_192_part_00
MHGITALPLRIPIYATTWAPTACAVHPAAGARIGSDAQGGAQASARAGRLRRLRRLRRIGIFLRCRCGAATEAGGACGTSFVVAAPRRRRRRHRQAANRPDGAVARGAVRPLNVRHLARRRVAVRGGTIVSRTASLASAAAATAPTPSPPPMLLVGHSPFTLGSVAYAAGMVAARRRRRQRPSSQCRWSPR